jgi:uncharacterized protein with von Willebrand factor type A (vWA) domain
MRATLRAMMRNGVVTLRKRERRERRPPLVVLCDISGSMGAYARMLLHFVHGLANTRNDPARMHVFLFGTRLTNVTRDLALRDPDAAIAKVTGAVKGLGPGGQGSAPCCASSTASGHAGCWGRAPWCC